MVEILVTKSNGELEPFDKDKLKQSLLRSNASIVVADEIATQITSKIKRSDTTARIYEAAFAMLKKRERKTALRYSLKRSMLTLGPTGFPFEKFIAKIFEAKGYKTKTGIELRGKCISHEVDGLIWDDDDLILAEVKFHNSMSVKTDTKVALYVKARYDDLKEVEINVDGVRRKPTNGLIITNTKFTHNAQHYAKCVGLGMISWDYPEKGNLYDLIEETGLQPLTSMTSLSKKEKSLLIQNGVIDCHDLESGRAPLEEIGMSTKKINQVLREVHEVCDVK